MTHLNFEMIFVCVAHSVVRGVISTFSWGGAKFLFIFQCHRTIEKLENNSTLYVVN